MSNTRPRPSRTDDLDVSVIEQHLKTLELRQQHGPDPEREQAIRGLRAVLDHVIHNPETAPDWSRNAPHARLALEQFEQRGEITHLQKVLRMLKRSRSGSLGTEPARRIRETTPPEVINRILMISSSFAAQDPAQQAKDLADRGEVDALVQRADTGDRDAALQLARLLTTLGDVERLTSRATAGDQFASLQLARLLAARGDTEVLTARADAGDHNAAAQLATLLAQHGGTEALTARADAGEQEAAAELAQLLADRGELETLTARAAAGDQFAVGQLGRVQAGKRYRANRRRARNAATVQLPADHKDVGVRDVAGKFEVYKDRAGKYRFRLKASNGQVVATGEAYETKAAALKGCESVQRAAEGAPVVETEG